MIEFKIDTKPVYTIIAPAGSDLDANLSAMLAAKCHELAETGSLNFIIDLSGCAAADESSLEALALLHEDCYAKERSLVFTGISGPVRRLLEEHELNEVLNIAPTPAEATDMISMEILERDLFREE